MEQSSRGNEVEDFLGKRDNQPASQRQEALAALAGVVALQRQTDLHNAPPQQDKTHRADQRKDECGEIFDHDQRVICGKGGQVWGVMTGIHSALQAIGYGLLVLFFAVGVMKTCGSFVEVKKPEHALKLFIRFALAKGAVTYGLELMLAVFSIVQGMVSTIITQSGNSGMSSVTLPQELIDAINNVGFWDSIPLWAVTLIGGLLITVLSFTMILTVYGRMFSLWMYAAIAPIPLSTFAGEPTSSVGKNFIRSYAGVCLQGVVIALSCIIFSAISSSPPAVDTGASVVTAVWTYVGELAFNLLVLVGAIKGCDRIVKEIMGL